jgi:hypothetical protein
MFLKTPLAYLFACLSKFNVSHARERGTRLIVRSLGARIGSSHPKKKTISLLGIISKETTTVFLGNVLMQEGREYR